MELTAIALSTKIVSIPVFLVPNGGFIITVSRPNLQEVNGFK